MSGEKDNATTSAFTASMETIKFELPSSGGNTSTSAMTSNTTLEPNTFASPTTANITTTASAVTLKSNTTLETITYTLPSTADTETITSRIALQNNATTAFSEPTTQPKLTTTNVVSNLTAEPTLQMTAKSPSTNQPTEISTFSSSETFESPTTINLTTTTNTLIGNLEIWQLCVIVGFSALAVIALITTVCCIRRRKKKNKYKKEHELREMWNMGTGGAEISMINMTQNVDRWKSSESVDQTVTTADVVAPPTVNVFNANRDGNENGHLMGRLSRQNTATSINSSRSRGSLKSIHSDASSMFKKSKPKKILTKVKAPTISDLKQDGKEQSVSDFDETTDDGEDEKSPASSMMSENLTTPKMETFRSQGSSPQPRSSEKSSSPLKSSSNPSSNNLSSVTATSSASAANSPEAQTNMNMSSFSKNKTAKRNSALNQPFLNPIDLPSPPPPPPEET